MKIVSFRQTVKSLVLLASIWAGALLQAQDFSANGKMALKKGQFTKAIDLYHTALEDIDVHGSPRLKAECQNNLGIAFFSIGEIGSSIESYRIAIDIYKENGLDSLLAQTSLNLALAYKRIGDYEHALEILLNAKNLLVEGNQNREAASALNTIGNIYREMGEFEHSISTHKQALAIRKKIKNQKGEAGSYNNLGMAYLEMGVGDSAKHNFFQSLELKIALRDSIGIGSTLANLGEVAIKEQKYSEAKDLLERSLILRRIFDDRKGEAVTLMTLGEIAIYEGELRNARSFLAEADTISRQVGALDTQVEVALLSKEVEVRKKKYRSALKHYDRYLLLKDSLLDISKVKALQNLRIKYESEKKEQMNRLLSSKNDEQGQKLAAQQGFLILTIIVIALLVLIAINSWKASKNKKRIAEREIQLKREMHHRIANDLASISGLLGIKLDEMESKESESSQKGLKQARSSIESIQAVHRLIYSPTSLGNQTVSFELVFNAIWESNLIIFGKKELETKGDFQIESLEIDSEDATLIGVVVNELICNAFKYQSQELAPIDCRAWAEKSTFNIVFINRVSSNGSYKSEPRSGGTEILKGLIGQLKGEIQFSPQNGAFEVEASWPIKKRARTIVSTRN